jgi:hypothetical protein
MVKNGGRMLQLDEQSPRAAARRHRLVNKPGQTPDGSRPDLGSAILMVADVIHVWFYSVRSVMQGMKKQRLRELAWQLAWILVGMQLATLFDTQIRRYIVLALFLSVSLLFAVTYTNHDR